MRTPNTPVIQTPDPSQKPIKRPNKSTFWSVVLVVSLLATYALGYTAGYAHDLKASSFAQTFSDRFVKTQLGTTDFNIFWSVLDVLRDKFAGTIDYKNLVYSSTKGLVEGLGDPYSEFATPEENRAFFDSLEGRYEGVGLEMDIVDGVPIVLSTIKGSPAAAADIKPRDIILAIDGKTVEGQTPTELLTKIRGRAGTKVKISLARADKIFEVELTRTEIKVPSLELSFTDGIGVLHIRKFAEDSGKLFKEAVNEIIKNNPKGLILDMRSNPGGLLDQSVQIANEFLGKDQVIVEQRLKDGKTTAYKADGKGRLQHLKIIVLVDTGSASASEIVAGALRDNGKARLVGEQTYGKGSIQEIDQFADGSALKITVGYWYTPKGISISPDGLKPDTEMKQAESGEDNILEYAKRELLK